MYFYIYFYMILSFYFIWFYYHILFAIYLISCYIYFFIFYLFSHLAGAFVQNDLQMRTIEAIKNQQKSNNMQVLWQVLVSLTQ